MTSSTASRPMPRPGILDIEAYVGGKSSAHGVSKVYKLSSNESPLGANPKAIEAYRSIAEGLELYPDGSAIELREAIGRAYGLAPERIVCGCGSDEILHLLTQAYVGPGDEGLYPEYGFLVYPIAIRSFGGIPVTAPETNHTVDVDALLAKVTERTRIVFLANPANPTGTYIPFDEVRRLHKGLPSNVLLVLDAAYAEYVGKNDYEAGIELAGSADNVIMTRTFSKIHGLANLRIGWAYGPDHVIDVLNRIRGPFNLSGASIAAGTASINDREFVRSAAAFNDEWLERVTNAVRALGLEVTPSVTNFILVHFPTTPGKTAPEADDFLQSRGLIVRRLNAYGLPNALRMTIGTPEANEAFVAALAEFVR